ncbi:MAG TPA: PVC-type heme-binding CxxCH protein [Lacipirellulaceae bacterium]|nr:PVC-type heme-binding CxxCH protein [Lacipirellulaceae bacterium]
MAREPGSPTASEFELPRVPPKSPQEALAAFEVSDGFRIELVAAEPLVVDPVAMAFDERGRLYVVEMRDYSEQDKERLGRVRLLSDQDGDGKFDTSRVFVEGLSWPTALACYNGGVFIGSAPDILYCKDTDGDDVADQQEAVFTGFGRGNVQGLLNSFQWGLDQRIYGATSGAGAQVIRIGVVRGQVTSAQQAPLDLRGRDFAFDPKSLAIEARTGGGQHGLSFNRWGDRFVCHNSDHLQAIVFEERYLARNPLQSVLSARRSIAADGPQAAVYRISPVEAWRVARTKLRVAGLVPGPIEGGGQPAGYFTSATGVTVYEGGLWGSEDETWVFVADVGSNLIHRKRLVADGVTYRGERIDEQTEFVRSSDIWFRPVQMTIGPEGALYVADMYREVIEHPASLPPELKRQLDLTSGNDRGRIYRIVPAGYRQVAPPSLGSASTAELVAVLEHANAWRRATASRLLYERQDTSAAKLLRTQFAVSKRPETRIAILNILSSFDTLTESDVVAGLQDAHPQVRRHAVRICEPLLDSSAEVRNKVLQLTSDLEPVVQFQLALSLGECIHRDADRALSEILARHSSSQDIADAVLTSMNGRAGGVLKHLLEKRDWFSTPEADRILSAIVTQIVRQASDADVAVIVAALENSGGRSHSAASGSLLRALSRLPAASFENSKSPQLAELQKLRQSAAAAVVRNARTLLTQDEATLNDRVMAIETLALDRFENHRELFEELLSPQEPAAIQAAVLKACAEFNSPEVAELVLSAWNAFGPSERSQATELLLRREPWALELLRQLTDQGATLATLDPAHRAKLENYPSERVRTLARKLRGDAVSVDRQQVFKDYEAALSAEGRPARGKEIFDKNCSACHAIDSRGMTVGPNLATMVNRGAESLLFNVLVPNGEVDPRYLEYVVVTVDGQVISGILAGETSTALTIRAADNKTTTVLRVDIEEIDNLGKSLMPEGFEKVIDKKAMADLLAYLRHAAAKKGEP